MSGRRYCMRTEGNTKSDTTPCPMRNARPTPVMPKWPRNRAVSVRTIVAMLTWIVSTRRTRRASLDHGHGDDAQQRDQHWQQCFQLMLPALRRDPARRPDESWDAGVLLLHQPDEHQPAQRRDPHQRRGV